MNGTLQYVAMSEVKIGRRTDRLKATLGSCVGIAIIWKKGERCGLAHCLLPDSPAAVLRVGARYVDQAIPSLVKLMGIKPDDYPDIEVIVAGGARMFKIGTSNLNVGKLNTDATERYLLHAGISISHQETGGRRGRQIEIDCLNYSFSIKHIATEIEDRQHECT